MKWRQLTRFCENFCITMTLKCVDAIDINNNFKLQHTNSSTCSIADRLSMLMSRTHVVVVANFCTITDFEHNFTMQL